MEGVTGLVARLLYGTGMRLMEALKLRVKDLETTMIYTHVLTVGAWACGAPSMRWGSETDRAGCQFRSEGRSLISSLEPGTEA